MRFYVFFICLPLAAYCLCSCTHVDEPTFSDEAHGATYFLSTEGSDTRNGKSEASAWFSWEYAISQLDPGDTLLVLPGTYELEFGSFELSDLGPSESGKSTKILSKVPGTAILKTSQRPLNGWEAIGPGLYRCADNKGSDVACGFVGETYLHNYQSLQDLKEARNKTAGYHRGGEYFPGPEHGLAYDAEHIYLKLPDGLTPEGLQLVMSQQPLVQIMNSPELIFDGFQLQGRSTAISIDSRSDGSVVRNCAILGATYGVLTDADHTLVEHCEFTVPGLEQFNKALMEKGTYIYYFMKERGLEGGLVYSRKVPSPRFLEARYNYIHNVFDGDGLGQFDDSTIHHSVYHNCFDNAVEFEPNVKGKSGANLHYYLNRVSGYSRGYLSHQQNGTNRENAERGNWQMQGPHYVHHNVIIADGNNEKTGWKPWTILKTRPWDNEIKIIYSHNLIIARTRANLFWNDPKWEQGLTNMEWSNNVILLPEGAVESSIPFTGQSNVLYMPEPRPTLTGARGIYTTDLATLKYRDNAPDKDPQPLKESPLRHQATRIDAAWLQGLQNEAIGPFTFDDENYPNWPNRDDFNSSTKATSLERLYPIQ